MLQRKRLNYCQAEQRWRLLPILFRVTAAEIITLFHTGFSPCEASCPERNSSVGFVILLLPSLIQAP